MLDQGCYGCGPALSGSVPLLDSLLMVTLLQVDAPTVMAAFLYLLNTVLFKQAAGNCPTAQRL
jgi:hypothetical protein